MPVSGDKIVRGTSEETLYTGGPYPPTVVFGVHTEYLTFVAESVKIAIGNLGRGAYLYRWDGSSWQFIGSRVWNGSSWVNSGYDITGTYYEKSVGANPQFMVRFDFQDGPGGGGGSWFIGYIYRKPKIGGAGNKVYYYNHSTVVTNNGTTSNPSPMDAGYKTNQGLKITPALQLNMTD